MLQICSDWLASTQENEASGSSSANEPKLDRGGADLPPNTEGNLDFSRPLCVSSWAEKSFLVALNRAEKISNHIRAMDGVPLIEFLIAFFSGLPLAALSLNLLNCFIVSQVLLRCQMQWK